MPSAKMTSTSLSSRALRNIAPDSTKELLGAVFGNVYEREKNEGGVVLMGIAENKLMHEELVEYLNSHLEINPKMLTYDGGPSGTHELRTALAEYITLNFKSREEVKAENVTVMNGVSSVIDALAFCVAEPGEGILIAQPLYMGFVGDFEDRAEVKPVCVPMHGDDVVSLASVARHEAAYLKAESEGTHIRALMLCNPHNPMGRCYSGEVIEAYMRLCDKYNIHLICDEVYARSVFASKDIPNPVQFTSVLSLNISQFIAPSLVHVLYGMSKDFSCNGFRIGAFVSLHNAPLHAAMGCMARFSWASSLSQKAWLMLLRDEKWLEGYFEEMRRRMSESYDFCAGLLKGMLVPYEPANVGQFIWLDLSGFLHKKTLAEERKLAWKMIQAGVWLATGESFKSEIPGYFRLTFTSNEENMRLGMDRLKVALENYLDWKAC